MFERFGFADSFKWIAFDLFDERVDPLEDFLVSFLPIQVILPRMIGEYELQYKSSLSDPWPSSSWTIDSIRRLVFFGERNR